MLTESKKPALSFPRRNDRLYSHPRARQNGVVLMIALIVLVAMTLAGIALMRSVDTTNVIAGNMAFRQAATHAGDKGIEAALACLTTAAQTPTNLQDAYPTCGYIAKRSDPGLSQTWDDFWIKSLDGSAINLGTDTNGNQVKYVIHRLCKDTGDPVYAGCSVAPDSCDSTSSVVINSPCYAPTLQVYYRITSQITGLRNTASYVQSIIVM